MSEHAMSDRFPLQFEWDYWLIILSVIVAFIAAFIALETAGKVSSSDRRGLIFWRIAGGTTMGIGIWSMHFIGMLAMKFPVLIVYDVKKTSLSLVLAVISSILSLNLAVSGDVLTKLKLVGSSFLLGGGVVVMHYLGMAATMIYPEISWNLWMVALSIFIAIASSAVAMWLTFYLRIETENVIFYRMAAATIMGGAIAAMHYTGMGAAHFHQVVVPVQHGISIAGLSVWVTTTTLLILGGMLFVSMLDAQRKALKSNILLKEMNESLERCALYDSLTELPNRDFFDRKLKEAIQLAETTGKKFSLMYMDLDGFKLINDAWGHHVGDFLLKEVAKRFKSEMNDDLIVARLGGDEFVLFYNEDSLIKVKRLAEKLTGLIRMPFKYKEYMLRVSLSTGISVYPEHGKNAHELKFTADCAMYSVKEQGRDGWMIYDEKHHNSEHSQPVLLQELTHALDKGQLEVWYQPQVDALNGKIVAFEALLRWAHPRRGVMPPDTFMRLAEKTALILSIGRWVLDESCKKLNEWNSQNSSELKLSINLSELQFYNFQLIEDIKKALYKHNISPNRLTFEINSSAVLKDITRSSCILKKLNALQVNISLNDYGNCISDILHLQNIPVSELKLNRDFVRSEWIKENHAEMLNTFITIGKQMNMTIAAEGIETEEQRVLFSQLGCNVLQGHYFAKALHSSEIDLLFMRETSVKMLNTA